MWSGYDFTARFPSYDASYILNNMFRVTGHIKVMKDLEQTSPSIHTLTNVSESRSIVSLKIYDQSDQSGSNGCDQSVCQQLCLPKPHNDYTCRCTLEYLLENETECKEDTKNDKVIQVTFSENGTKIASRTHI